jgi:SAM-dependent methyltransferase
MPVNKLKYRSEYDIDDPRQTVFHSQIIQSKPFLKKIYREWYQNFIEVIPSLPNGKMLEIGSGGGFLKDLIPNVITSDIMPLPTCDMTFSAENLPFKSGDLSAIFMVNVLHHIPNPANFFKEAEEKLALNGVIIMVETANSYLSKFIYKNFHHEPFDENAGWLLDSKGPMSSSNQALPYIIFQRDRSKFETQFPLLKIQSIKYHTPIRYILSGGVSRKAFVPDFTFSFFTALEKIISPINGIIGMFETVKIIKSK